MQLHECVQLCFGRYRIDALAGIGIRNFYNGDATHSLNPHRYLSLGDVPNGLRRMDSQAQSNLRRVVKIVRF